MNATRQNYFSKLSSIAGTLLTRYRSQIQEYIWANNPNGTKLDSGIRALVKIIYIVFIRFKHSRIPVHASALTYTTMLSILPLAAVLLAIISQTQLWDLDAMRLAVQTKFPEFEAIATPLMDLLSQTNFKSLGLAGTLFLAGAIFSMLGKIEAAFNDIWSIPGNRFFLKKVIDYSLLLLIVAVMMAAAWGAEILSADYFEKSSVSNLIPAQIKNIGFLSWAFSAIGFSVLITFLPNRHVPYWAGLAGGILAGIAYSFLSKTYFGLQVGVANYNLVYSSLAALPITVIWIDISWIIILICAQVSYGLTVFRSISRQQIENWVGIGYVGEAFLATSILLVKRTAKFQEVGVKPGDLTGVLGLPVHLVSGILERLVEEGIARKVGWAKYRIDEEIAKATVISRLLEKQLQAKSADSIENENHVFASKYMKDWKDSLKRNQYDTDLFEAAFPGNNN